MDDSTHQLCAGCQYKPIFNVSLLRLAHVQCVGCCFFCFFFPKSLDNWQFDFLLVKAADCQAHLCVLKVLSDL